MLHVSFTRCIDLSSAHPKLYTSLLRIHAHHVPQSSKREEALANMAISCRGSIRKAANIVTTAKMSTTLWALGDTDYVSFIKMWNSRASRSHQIVGQKAIGLKLLLEIMRPELLETALQHVGKEGRHKCAFSDDNLEPKRFTHRASSLPKGSCGNPGAR